MKTETPNFAAWHHDTLAKYAREQYEQNVQLQDALAQVRSDLKDAMKLLREKTK